MSTSGLLDVIRSARYDSMPRFLLKVVRKGTSYDEVVANLRSGRVNIHGFANVIGTNKGEGCSITLNDAVNAGSSIAYLDGPFLVVTNGDEDSFSKKRRRVAEERLSALGDARLEKEVVMRQVNGRYPNRNWLTIFVSVQQPEDGYIENEFYQ